MKLLMKFYSDDYIIYHPTKNMKIKTAKTKMNTVNYFVFFELAIKCQHSCWFFFKDKTR